MFLPSPPTCVGSVLIVLNYLYYKCLVRYIFQSHDKVTLTTGCVCVLISVWAVVGFDCGIQARVTVCFLDTYTIYYTYTIYTSTTVCETLHGQHRSL